MGRFWWHRLPRLASFGIRGEGLESAEWDEENGSVEDEGDDEEDGGVGR
jgi:hypothetical protein